MGRTIGKSGKSRDTFEKMSALNFPEDAQYVVFIVAIKQAQLDNQGKFFIEKLFI